MIINKKKYSIKEIKVLEVIAEINKIKYEQILVKKTIKRWLAEGFRRCCHEKIIIKKYNKKILMG